MAKEQLAIAARKFSMRMMQVFGHPSEPAWRNRAPTLTIQLSYNAANTLLHTL